MNAKIVLIGVASGKTYIDKTIYNIEKYIDKPCTRTVQGLMVKLRQCIPPFHDVCNLYIGRGD